MEHDLFLPAPRIPGVHSIAPKRGQGVSMNHPDWGPGSGKMAYPDAPGPSYAGVGPESSGRVWTLKSLWFGSGPVGL